MASWKDGAAYAPVERPDGFAMPVADPLSTAEEREPETPGAVPHPARLEPVQAPPLASLGHREEASRNAHQPFEVQSAAITSMALRADGTRDPHVPFKVTAPVSVAPVDAPPPPPGARPVAPPPEQDALDSSKKALLWLMVAAAGAGVILHTPAPFLLVAAGLLGVTRVPSAERSAGAALGVGSFLLVVQLLIPTVQIGFFSGLASAVFGVLFLVAALQSDPPPQTPPDQQGWINAAPPHQGPFGHPETQAPPPPPPGAVPPPQAPYRPRPEDWPPRPPRA